MEDHGGRPAQVRGTAPSGDVGVLSIDFPGGAGEEELEPISWADWFEKFDGSDRALLYQERKADRSDSPFNKFVERG